MFISKHDRFIYSVLTILIYIIVLPVISFSQNTDLLFKRYSVDDGLSQSRVYYVAEDYQGFIWIGTEGGLNKFDGYEFHSFEYNSSDPSCLNSKDIRHIFQDRKNRLWIGVAGNGALHRYNRELNNFISYNVIPQDSLNYKSTHIVDICDDQNGNIWIKTPRNGVYCFNPDSVQKGFSVPVIDNSLITQNMQPSVKKFYNDKNGNLWICASEGLYLYNINTHTFKKFYHDPENPNSLLGNYINNILVDSNGYLWVITNRGTSYTNINGLGSIDQSSVRFSHISPKNNYFYGKKIGGISSICEDKDKNIWFGSSMGLKKLDLKKIKLENGVILPSSFKVTYYEHNPLNDESLNFNNVRTICCDKAGLLWVGTSVGLNKSKYLKFTHYKQDFNNKGLSNNKVESILEDKNGNVWIGTAEGVDFFNRRTRQFHHVLPGPILSSCQDKSGLIWFGTWYKGLVQYNPVTRQILNYTYTKDDPNSLSGTEIFSVYEDSKNNLWVALWSGGLNLFNRRKQNFVHYKHQPDNNKSISSDHVTSIFEDMKGNLWIGTQNGLNLLISKERGIFSSFWHNRNDTNSLSNNNIICLNESASGDLWIGTFSGLNKFNHFNNTFLRYDTEDGLPDERIMGVIEDDSGDLWVSTMNGLCKFELSRTGAEGELTKDNVVYFDVDDGLQSREFVNRSYFKGKKGELYFGGIKGLNVFHPDSISDNPITPEVYITGLQMFNKDINIGQVLNGDTILKKSISATNHLRLSYENNVISFLFTALNFIAPEKTEYAFIMEGFDRSWNYIGTERKASYTNLEPGNYLFKVKAANNDGVWNNTATELAITITPPYWKSWWFRSLLIIFLASLAVALFELRVLFFKRQKRILEQKVNERTAEVVRQKDEIEKQRDSIEKKNLQLEIKNDEILSQTNQIHQMYELLKKHNIKLEHDVKNLSEARVMQKLISFNEFKKIYPEPEDCYKFLEDIKWKNGFKCRKCGHKEYSKDKNLMRRCKSCNYKESVTTGTIFHRLRFPIDKAFYILIVTSTGRELNISQLAKTLSLRMKTCWDFHNKIIDVMKNRNRLKNPKDGWKELILNVTKKKDASQAASNE